MDKEENRKKWQLSRRQLLALALAGGVVGITARMAPTFVAKAVEASSKTAAQKAVKTRQWVMVFDLRKCEGCVTNDSAPQCVEACNAEHFVPKGQEWIRIFQVEGAAGHSYFMPRPCMQCENAPCVKVCPVGASYKSPEGITLVDHERCIGCRMCMAACPYGVRVFNWTEPENPAGATFANYSPEYPIPHRKGTVEKCMLCAHKVKDGKLPACVDGCPMYAIYLGDLSQDIATNGKELVKLSTFLAERSAFRLKEELGTRPRVWYIPGHGEDYGHHVGDERQPSKARSWQEMGATLANPHGGHKR